jgi:H+/Cl- antiporter ClcA
MKRTEAGGNETGASIGEPARRAARMLAAFLKWVLLGFAAGVPAGTAGALLLLCVARATALRTAHGWLVFLLPAGGLFIVFLYRIFGAPNPRGTDLVIEAVRSPEKVPLKMAPLIFAGTVVTHLFGGSAGREGAALQIGGSLGYGVGRVFRLNEKDLHLLTLCGMAACFSALFGTPVTATVFVAEVVTVGVMYYSALVPCAVASLVGAGISRLFRFAPAGYAVAGVPAVGWRSAALVTVLAALCAAVSVLFCSVLRGAGRLCGRAFRSPYLRAAAGGAAVALLSLVFGTDYLGAGGGVIAAALKGRSAPWAFALKLLFTALTLGAGFKGGEIVPSLFVGATFGCAAGGMLGLSPSFSAAVGMLAVFCGVTNCPLAAFLLAVELFGERGAALYLLAAGVSYMLSGYSGIYSKQRILYAKDGLVFRGGGPSQDSP